MYLMYVDESGDPGLSGTPYFALSGITVHENRWQDLTQHLLTFRRTMRAVHGLPVRSEIHSAEYLRKPPIPGMNRHTRFIILRNMIDELAKIDYISITNVVVSKVGKPPGYDVFENAWKILFQRFENTMAYGNFPGAFSADKGMVFVDNTNGKKLTQLVRKMAVYNPIPISGGAGYRVIPTIRIIEDPHSKDSADSYCVQACDVSAYFLYQSFHPNSFVRRQGRPIIFPNWLPFSIKGHRGAMPTASFSFNNVAEKKRGEGFRHSPGRTYY